MVNGLVISYNLKSEFGSIFCLRKFKYCWLSKGTVVKSHDWKTWV